MCLYIFYEQGHAWKKELVVVGFQYTTNLPFDGTQSMHEQVIAQTHFRGSWVTSETDSDTGSDSRIGSNHISLAEVSDSGNEKVRYLSQEDF